MARSRARFQNREINSEAPCLCLRHQEPGPGKGEVGESGGGGVGSKSGNEIWFCKLNCGPFASPRHEETGSGKGAGVGGGGGRSWSLKLESRNKF